ncbi:hypothetical protein [Pseudomonas rhizosphaerae]|jgi:hypothetical protein|uniref:hypothetical protein n=1 Tax=Pseudomonas rhizosphaerae TaxID=216142 RepID=UPI002B464538|nr:hypothetical protein [Pseudomonas rhizosphaerae]MEB2871629.1 hypothetical protein [Pseudomonas rhizosphaerae]
MGINDDRWCARSELCFLGVNVYSFYEELFDLLHILKLCCFVRFFMIGQGGGVFLKKKASLAAHHFIASEGGAILVLHADHKGGAFPKAPVQTRREKVCRLKLVHWRSSWLGRVVAARGKSVMTHRKKARRME